MMSNIFALIVAVVFGFVTNAAPINAVKGTVQAAMDPVGTLQGIGHAVTHPVETVYAKIDDINEKLQSLEGQGELGFEIVNLFLPTPGAPVKANNLPTGSHVRNAGNNVFAQVDRTAPGVMKHHNEVKPGIYEFPDMKRPGQTYVGQSSDLEARIKKHQAAGRAPKTTEVKKTEIPDSDKLTREIAEHTRIQEITGGVPARLSDAVSNQRDPIGPARIPLMVKKE
jgi:hypothetical protein